MANTNESFIDEVAEAVRRDRINLWFRRWGWLLALLVLAIVAVAGYVEWREAQRRTDAEFRGEAILTALRIPDTEERLAALRGLPLEGQAGAVAALVLAGEQLEAGDPAAAEATLSAVAADLSVSPLYRDLAALKAQLVQGTDADPAVLEALAAPGAPFRLLAQEQIALIELANGNREQAVARLRDIREDADVALSPGQLRRIEALLTGLGVSLDDDPAAPQADVPAPIGE